MNRRSLLVSIGMVGLAGCSIGQPPNGGSNGGGGNGQSQTTFDQVTLSGPDSARIGGGFSITVSARNAGESVGTFSAKLVVGQDPFREELTVQVANVPPGETKSTRVGPINPGYAGSVEFELPDYGVSKTVQVDSREARAGNAVAVGNLELTLSGFTYYPSLIAQSEKTQRLVTPRGERAFAAVRVSAKNNGQNPIRLSADTFTVGDGSPLRQLGPFDDLSTLRLEGKSLHGVEIPAEKSDSGWFIAEITPEEELSVTWNTNNDDLPEIIWDLSDLSPPNLTVTDQEFPELLRITNEEQIEIDVKNDGDATVTVPYALEGRRPLESQWNQEELKTVKIEPGFKKTLKFDIERNYVGPYWYQIRPFLGPTSLEWQPELLEFGKTHTDPRGMKLTARDPLIAKEYRWNTEFEGGLVDKGLSEFLFVHMEAELSGDEPLNLPNRENFRLRFTDEQYGPEYPDTDDRVDYINPVQGKAYPNDDVVESPDDVKKGWLAFELVSTATVNFVTLEFVEETDEGNVVVRWKRDV